VARDLHEEEALRRKQEALLKARDLVDRLETHDSRLGWKKEKQLLLLLGVVAIAVVGFVGLSMMMGGSKEKDLERHRCEQDYVVKRVWEYGEQLKKERGSTDMNALAGDIDKKRAEFKEEAKAACGKTK
jgi:hypothetical protein